MSGKKNRKVSRELQLIQSGSIWQVPTPTDEPTLHLERWRIALTDANSRHAVGYCPERFEGRVSTAIVEFNRERMQLRTESGRLYSLMGAPGRDSDGEYVWLRWMRVNECAESADVTKEYVG